MENRLNFICIENDRIDERVIKISDAKILVDTEIRFVETPTSVKFGA